MTRIYFVLLVFLVLSCEDALVPDGSSREQNIEDFEAAWSYIYEKYPPAIFEYKQIDWLSLYRQYRSETEATNGDDFFRVLTDLIGELKDPHAKVHTMGGSDVFPYRSPRMVRDEGAFDPNLIRKFFEEPLLVVGNDAIEYQFIAPDIGYVRLSTFGGDLRGHHQEFENVVRYFSQATALIVDLRENDGGTTEVSWPILSHLLREPVLTGRQLRYDILIPKVWIDPHPSLRFRGDIAVLINGTTFSSGEVFADLIRGPEHVTLIGDTTAGGGMGSNGERRFLLPSGKAISINYSAVLRRDSVLLEWNGVPPDLIVSQTREDIRQGRDRILEFALEYLGQ